MNLIKLKELVEKVSQSEEQETAIISASQLLDLLSAMERMHEALERNSKVLDHIMFECHARTYTLDEDNFENIWFARDEADAALEDVEKILEKVE